MTLYQGSTASVGVTNKRAVYRSQQDSMGARARRKSTFSTPATCPSRVDPALGPLSYIIICARNKTVARYHAIQQN